MMSFITVSEKMRNFLDSSSFSDTSNSSSSSGSEDEQNYFPKLDNKMPIAEKIRWMVDNNFFIDQNKD